MEITSHPLAALTIAVIMLISSLFQLLLCIGMPFGTIAYGGYHKGKLPLKLRVTSGIFTLVWMGFALLFIDYAGYLDIHQTARVNQISVYVLTVLMGLGTIANGMSRSRAEKLIWTPVVATCLCCCIYLWYEIIPR